MSKLPKGPKDEMNIFHRQLHTIVECTLRVWVNGWGRMKKTISMVLVLCKFHNYWINSWDFNIQTSYQYQAGFINTALNNKLHYPQLHNIRDASWEYVCTLKVLLMNDSIVGRGSPHGRSHYKSKEKESIQRLARFSNC